GDTITAINGKTVATPDDLSQALAQLAPGDKAQVALLGQDGSQRTVTVTLGELPG
ncbi:MAG: PDZ domain-containing protein, partial [Candidatus Dormibacteraeota bacterium]|nr:PDZ domain-containing protein [Candidatus Dormibacteraeota bacterium]